MSCGDIGPIDYGCKSHASDALRYTISDVVFTKTTEKKMSKIKEIKIRQLDYGYVLDVGCKQIALDSPDKIIYALKQYFRNPENTEHKFLKGELKFEK